jgi:hypothetical protein
MRNFSLWESSRSLQLERKVQPESSLPAPLCRRHGNAFIVTYLRPLQAHVYPYSGITDCLLVKFIYCL